MKALLRIFVVASAALLAAGTPALAQETTPAPRNDVIGPPQLQDFSLNGTVTRPAPAPVQQEPPQATARPTNEQRAQPATSPPTQSTRSAQADSPAPGQTAARVPSSASADLPPPTPARRVATPSVVPSAQPSSPAVQPDFSQAQADTSLDGSDSAMPFLPWLLAALALAGAAAWYFLRQRPRESYAGAGAFDMFEAPSPAPSPPVRAPPPAPPKQPSSSGVVATRLRPWLEIEFTPGRAIVDDQKAAVQFELSVFNSGSAPARNVLLEASLFNAGPTQDQQIRLFFENPVAKGDRIPVIPPLQRVAINTAVFLPRDQVRPIEIEGRQLFVPMIAFNALYGWGGGEGQSSASYLVGKTTKTDKLAPFRLDLGPRIFRSLDSREHELRLRK